VQLHRGSCSATLGVLCGPQRGVDRGPVWWSGHPARGIPTPGATVSDLGSFERRRAERDHDPRRIGPAGRRGHVHSPADPTPHPSSINAPGVNHGSAPRQTTAG
ncbi:MAG: hypothetical protein ACRDQX_09760, partial [Pseudonocardiaceae bacterium]